MSESSVVATRTADDEMHIEADGEPFRILNLPPELVEEIAK